MSTHWFIYIVRCSDNTLYTGVTKNIESRINDHNTSPKGAKYTKGRRPVKLIYQHCVASRSEAQKEEYRIKQLSKKLKEELILGIQNRCRSKGTGAH